MQRILILRLSAVGDTILSMPILCGLRRAFPSAQLGWVVAAGAAELLQGHECLDELIVLTKQDQKSFRAYASFLGRVRAWKPDVVIDAQGLTKSAWIGWCSGAATRIGLSHSEFDGRELSGWLNNRIITPTTEHVVLRGLELLKPLGIEDTTVEFQVPRFAEAATKVATQISDLNLGQAWATINVGAGWPSKVWPADRYAAVAKHLKEHWGRKSLVVWGGAKEKEMAEQVVQLAKGCAVMAPATSLQELAEWIRVSSLFVGSDTGPMHLAVALGIPTVGIIGPMPTERVGPMGMGGPFADLHASVQNVRLPRSQVHDRKTECRPMLSIMPRHVTEACDRVLRNALSSSSAAA
jgi:heptosyltransferase I